MRLNRANSAVGDHERIHRETGGGTVQDRACASLWRELVGTSFDRWLEFDYLSLELGNWKRRTELLEFCTTVVDQALIEKQSALEGQAQNPTSRRKVQGALFEDEVKVFFNMIRHEQWIFTTLLAKSSS